jgi:hypothetical protein
VAHRDARQVEGQQVDVEADHVSVGVRRERGRYRGRLRRRLTEAQCDDGHQGHGGGCGQQPADLVVRHVGLPLGTRLDELSGQYPVSRSFNDIPTNE